MSDSGTLKSILEKHWMKSTVFNDSEVQKCVGQFYDCIRTNIKAIARIKGNYGFHVVSIELINEFKGILNYSCSCYIGKNGNCHHCLALIKTFLNNPDSFENIELKESIDIKNVAEIKKYLESTTLDSLIKQLKAKGITQKAFAESMKMPINHLNAIKRSELKEHFFNELGSVKLACLWALEHLNKETKKQ